jgi:hypothetical protein
MAAFPRWSVGTVQDVLLIVLLLCFSSVIQAAAPSFIVAGAKANGTAAITPVWPAHQAGDIALLFVQTANQAVTLSSNTAGFAQVTNSPQGTRTAGSTTSTRLTVFWTRATSSTMANPTISDSGNNQVAQILIFRNVVETGNPWDITAGDVRSTASTSFSIPGNTTNVDNDLIVAALSSGTDTSAGQASGWTNASLTSLTEIADTYSTSGNGGGFAVAVGAKTTAGVYSATTGTITTSSVQGRLSIALKPKITTLSDGINPANTTLAPGGAITALDAFNLVTNGEGIIYSLPITNLVDP